MSTASPVSVTLSSFTPRPGPACDLAHGDLRVAPDGRSLQHADGHPFFWLADTAWELLHRLTRDEIRFYLDARRAQGYTVVQVVALAEFDGLTEPTPEGFLPLLDHDPLRPDPSGYWERLDWLLGEAAARGMFIALLPTWGDKVVKAWGRGPEIFTPANAEGYGRWLGARLAHHRNLVWVNGGDRSPHQRRPGNDGTLPVAHQLAVWRALAAGLIAGDGGRHLITFHPGGGDSSGRHVHGDAWLAFNGQQNGHNAHPEVWERIRIDRERLPTKPVIDLEPLYEEHPIAFNLDNGWATAWHVRWFAWCDLLAGAAGHTYGCHPMWQFYEPGREPKNHPRIPWQTALQLPGAWQMGLIRDLLLARGFPALAPCPGLLQMDPGSGAERIQASRRGDGACALVYTAFGRAVAIDLTFVSGEKVRAWWFDPRSGAVTAIGEVPRSGSQRYVPPTAGPGQDWVLVLDDADAALPPLTASAGT